MNIETLLHEILREYRLPWFGLHGLSHWGRVLENGLHLADETGADRDVVTLFALFHDSRRVNEGHDPGHGARGADFAAELRGLHFELDDKRLFLLHTACVHHTDGLTEGDITVQTCWDADRLDLGRVGERPLPSLLCTDAARDPEVLEWAHERAESEVVCDAVREIWDAKQEEL